MVDTTYKEITANNLGTFLMLEGNSNPTIVVTLTNSGWYCNADELWASGKYNPALSLVSSSSSNKGNTFYFETGATGTITS